MEHADFVPLRLRALGIGLGQRMPEVRLVLVGVPLDQENASLLHVCAHDLYQAASMCASSGTSMASTS